MKSTQLIFAFFISIATLMAQTPQQFKYQAALRNADGTVMANQEKTVVVNLLLGDSDGPVVFSETHTVTTSITGIINLNIGSLTSLEGINWASETYFVQISVDGNILGTSQLLSVPYALHAKAAENLSGSIFESQITDLQDYLTQEEDPLFSGWDKSSGISISESQIVDLQNYLLQEADPLFSTWDKSTGIVITESQVSNLQSYLIEESQTLAEVVTRGNSVNGQIKNLEDPTEAQDAATKAYVDALETKVNYLENLLIDAGLYKVEDVEGNAYSVVRIGNQVWMAQNLRTTKYNDGTNIPLVTDNEIWQSLTTPGFAWFNNDPANYSLLHGGLYNWFSVNPSTNGNKNICPVGWHLPSNNEWSILTTTLGGTSVAGGKMKHPGTTYWNEPNTGATNESGFTAFGSGRRTNSSTFVELRTMTFFWTSTNQSESNAWYQSIGYWYGTINNNSLDKRYGVSIRCIMD